ncbi:hypothetical protein BDF20DRAFT_888871, partial [Mycotypha africana]|uniref:uncharacterized protein n=1 Tax=Mycotypha africana TaxID=64632 RepID=UPI0022FFEC44
MHITAEQAACSIYGLEVSPDNCTLAMKLLRSASLEPVTIVSGDPAFAIAMSTKRINMEPWKFKRLVSTHQTLENTETSHNNPQASTVATDDFEESSDSSSNISQSSASIAPSRSSVIDLCKHIMPLNPVPTLTQQLFLTEDEIFMMIKSYLPDGDLKAADLVQWMAKDGAWGPTKRKQINKQRKSGRWYNVIKEPFRDFTWKHITNVQQFRSTVKATASTICTIGYARKSNTKEPMAA